MKFDFAFRVPLFTGLLFVACLTAKLANAHDLWLVPAGPDQHRVGQALLVQANSGMDFPKSVQAADTALFAKRLTIRPDGSAGNLEPAGKEGDSGLLRFVPEHAGLHVVAVETQAKVISLEADKFNEYLVADGLPHIYRLRAKEQTLDQPARERYSKFPKALIQVGDAGAGDAAKALGLTLEIVPLANPFGLKPGDTLRVRVLFRNQPLADANLGWDHPDDGEPPSGTVRTDSRGEALVPIAHTGLMAIRLTHMTRPKQADYEWESFWTTLTFRVPDSPTK
jgi:uncharacterized GH25 family protein